MWKDSLRVGFLLGTRQIRHASIWTTGLIIFVMFLTSLNLVVVSGILVGLIEGSVQANRDQNTGDVFLSTLDGEEFIENTSSVLKTIETLPNVKQYSARFVESATVEANYRVRRDPKEVPDSLGTRIVGIDPIAEDATTHLSNYIIVGDYLREGDDDKVLLGVNMVDAYAPDFGDAFDTLDTNVGERVRITANGRTKEFVVKGIIDSKVDETSFRAFMLDSTFKQFAGRTNLNANEVAILAIDPNQEYELKKSLVDSGIGDVANIRVSREALPQAFEDIIVTFELLGTAMSSIGLLVGAITIFIVIFINAITRRKFIGILKGIGIRASAIEFSYVFQSIIYALVGAGLAAVVTYAVLVPLLQAYPIDFPFSDGILVAPVGGTIIRLSILLVSTVIAGYIPARMVIQKNTLDSILGR